MDWRNPLAELGGKVMSGTQVGDRYVLEDDGEIRASNVGGEQSGHMIFRDFTTTGDGIITALQSPANHARHGQAAQRAQALSGQVSAGPAELESARFAETLPSPMV